MVSIERETFPQLVAAGKAAVRLHDERLLDRSWAAPRPISARTATSSTARCRWGSGNRASSGPGCEGCILPRSAFTPVLCRRQRRIAPGAQRRAVRGARRRIARSAPGAVVADSVLWDGVVGRSRRSVDGRSSPAGRASARAPSSAAARSSVTTSSSAPDRTSGRERSRPRTAE